MTRACTARKLGVVALLIAMAVVGCGGDVEGARGADDTAALDEYAETLGLAMIKTSGHSAEDYARRVDGPDAGIEVLDLSTADHGAVVVLRVRLERAEPSWPAPGDTYEISACYRWELGSDTDDYQPERLARCPSVPVITLPPAPIEPALPDTLPDHLNGTLGALPDVASVDPRAVEDAVRAAYSAAFQEAGSRSGADAGAQLLDIADALPGDSWMIVDDGVVGVAVGRADECLLARVAPGEVHVWTPSRMSLQPGETGCSPQAAIAIGSGDQ